MLVAVEARMLGIVDAFHQEEWAEEPAAEAEAWGGGLPWQEDDREGCDGGLCAT